jgi:hypothetical protein
MSKTVRFLSVLCVGLCFQTCVGCNTLRQREPVEPLNEHGWITVGGSGLPASTLIVDSFGKSLAQVLQESQSTAILNERSKFLVSYAPQPPAVQPTPTDLQAAFQSFDNQFAEGDSLVARTIELNDILVELSGQFTDLELPKTWYTGWPNCLFEVEKPDVVIGSLSSLAMQIPEPELQRKAIEAISTLKSFNTDSDSLKRLSEFARDAKLLVPVEQKQLAWCYSGLFAARERNALLRAAAKELKNSADDVEKQAGTVILAIANGRDGDDFDNTADLEKLKNSFDGEIRAQLEMALTHHKRMEEFYGELRGLRVSASATTDKVNFIPQRELNGYSPDDALFAFIQKQTNENFLLPLEAVYGSELGGIWLFPNDKVSIMRFRELPASQTVGGERRIGVIGMTGSPGILQTPASTASTVIDDMASEVHPSSNMLMLTHDWNGAIVHALLPYGGGTSSQMQASIRASLERWAIPDGTVIKYDYMSLSPVMVKSKRFQQRAAERLAAYADSRSRLSVQCCANIDLEETMKNRERSRPDLVEESRQVLAEAGSRLGGWLGETRDIVLNR